MNPVIEINSSTSIKWTNPPLQTDPNGLNISVRVSIFKDSSTTIFQTIDTFTQSVGNIFDQLPSGSYAIKYKIGWSGTADSIISNSVTLASQVSATPTIVSFNATIPNNGSANVSISGVVGSALYSVRYSEQAQYLGIIDSSGIKNYSYTIGGSYKYYQIETGKSQSLSTSSILISDSTMLSCDNGANQFAINTATYNQTTSILTFVFTASNLVSANYRIIGSNNVVTAQGNVSPTSSTVNITLPQLGYGTFTLEIVGASCTGTATKTFSVVPSCNNGNQPFSVSSIVYNAGNLSFVFNAQFLSQGSWKIKQGVILINSGSVQPNSNNPSISVGTLPNGFYSFELTGQSCTGIATGNFTVGNVNEICPLPIGSITSNKSIYLVGETATITVSGLTNYTGIQWAKNGVLITGQTSNTIAISNVGTAQNGDKYQLRIENNCGGGKAISNVLSNEVILNIQPTNSTQRRYFIPVKMDEISGCNTETIQIGYSLTQVQPSIWVDTDTIKNLSSSAGVTTEVSTGGINFQVKAFDLQAGSYYFYARQKSLTSNFVYLGLLNVII